MHLKEALAEEADYEITKARLECSRLAGLFKEVCWYNFETQCRNWRRPWNQSMQQSIIVLQGFRITEHKRNGRTYEAGYFPVWYRGPVGHAPQLPPEIILIELKSAHDHLVGLERLRCNVFDWAPGGPRAGPGEAPKRACG